MSASLRWVLWMFLQDRGLVRVGLVSAFIIYASGVLLWCFGSSNVAFSGLSVLILGLTVYGCTISLICDKKLYAFWSLLFWFFACTLSSSLLASRLRLELLACFGHSYFPVFSPWYAAAWFFSYLVPVSFPLSVITLFLCLFVFLRLFSLHFSL